MDKSVQIEDIWLIKEGKDGDEEHGDTVVYVKMEGVWYEAIRENGNFSHCVTAYGLSEKLQPADWLNNEQHTEEHLERAVE